MAKLSIYFTFSFIAQGVTPYCMGFHIDKSKILDLSPGGDPKSPFVVAKSNM